MPSEEEEASLRRASHRFKIFRRFYDLASKSKEHDTETTTNEKTVDDGITFLQFTNTLKSLKKKGSGQIVVGAETVELDAEKLDRIHDIALTTFNTLDVNNTGRLTKEDVDRYAQRTTFVPENTRDGSVSPLGLYLTHHLTNSSDSPVGNPTSPTTTSNTLLNQANDGGDYTDSEDSSDGELGVPIEDEDIPPPSSGQLEVPIVSTEWSTPSKVEQSIQILSERDGKMENLPSATHLLIIKNALDHFLHQQEYFQQVAQQNVQLRNEIHSLASKQGRGPVNIPPLNTSKSMRSRRSANSKENGNDDENADLELEILEMEEQMNRLANALQLQMDENKIMRQAIAGIRSFKVRADTMHSEQKQQHQRLQRPKQHHHHHHHQQQQQQQQQQQKSSNNKVSPVGFGRINESHRTRRRDNSSSPQTTVSGGDSDSHTKLAKKVVDKWKGYSKSSPNGKKPKRLNAINRVDHQLDPKLVPIPQHRDYVRERSPDKTPKEIKKSSVSKVQHRMSNDVLELLKPTDMNYVEERSKFEAEVDSKPARRHWIAKKKNQSIDDFDYINDD